jgi:flagellar operon protein
MIDKLLPGQSLGPATPAGSLRSAQRLEQAGPAFRELLDESLRSSGGTKFSLHALKRIESRGIGLGPGEISSIESALDRAAAKGARDSLVLGGDYALVVNVPSRTVVTVLDPDALSEHVVTSIDSAVFVK